MHFELTQRFAADPADVADAYTDPGFYASLVSVPKLGAPDVLERTADGDEVVTRIRYRFVGDLSSAVKAVVDPAKLTWVEECHHDQSSRTATFVLHPDNYADRLRCQGQFRIEAAGDGSVRTVSGELKVRAPLVASSVERAIISGLQEHFEVEAPLVERYIAGE